MEHSIFISDIPALKYFMLSDFGRIYYGNEFCEHLLPTTKQLEAVLAFASANDVSLTLVTPILYDSGIVKVKKLLKILPRGTEVVINDLGLIDYIESSDLVPVHGRMLFSSIKDPRIDSTTPFPELFTAHNLQAPYLEMLKEHGVGRVEIDNAGQGYDLKTIINMSISLYYPYVNCTVTRKCVFANQANKSSGQNGGGFVVECKKQCGGKIIRADIDGSPVSIMGNAQFYRNEAPPENLESTGIDRLVFMPVFTNSNTGVSNLESLDWSFPYKTGAHENSWGTQLDETLKKLLKSIGLSKGTRALDIGCGAGRNAPILLQNEWQYTGIDISSEAIGLARKKLPGNDFIIGDATNNDWAGATFDVAIDYGCFHTLPPWKRRKYFQVMNSIITPGGYLIVAAWDGETSVTPIEYVCGSLPEWACSQAEFDKASGPEFEMKHTELREEGKWQLRYYVMKKIDAVQ